MRSAPLLPVLHFHHLSEGHALLPLFPLHSSPDLHAEDVHQWVDSAGLIGELQLVVSPSPSPLSSDEGLEALLVEVVSRSRAPVTLWCGGLSVDSCLRLLDAGLSALSWSLREWAPLREWLTSKYPLWPLSDVPRDRLQLELLIDEELHVVLATEEEERDVPSQTVPLAEVMQCVLSVCGTVCFDLTLCPSVESQKFYLLVPSAIHISAPAPTPTQHRQRVISHRTWQTLQQILLVAERYEKSTAISSDSQRVSTRFLIHHSGLDTALLMQRICTKEVCLLSKPPSDVLSTSLLREWLGKALLTVISTDRLDGLYSTVVVDEFGVALGLVFSSRDSILTACREKRGVYWSRSRSSLWRKGETSGAVQHLLSVALDCDGDALRFTVQQEGSGFCHLNRWSCWPSGCKHGIYGLMRTLLDRMRHPIAGSYTNRLLDDTDLLNSKLLEEAHELVAAEKSSEAAAEAADVLYFTAGQLCLHKFRTQAVKMCSMGVSMAEVEQCLDLRSLRVRRRKGDAKPAFPSHGISTSTS